MRGAAGLRALARGWGAIRQDLGAMRLWRSVKAASLRSWRKELPAFGRFQIRPLGAVCMKKLTGWIPIHFDHLFHSCRMATKCIEGTVNVLFSGKKWILNNQTKRISKILHFADLSYTAAQYRTKDSHSG